MTWLSVSFEGDRYRRATPNRGEEEEGEGRTGLTNQHTIYLVLNNVFGYSALEQGSVYKTWERDYCLTSKNKTKQRKKNREKKEKKKEKQKTQPHKHALLILFAWTAGKPQGVAVGHRTITYLLVTLFGSQNLDFFTLNHGKTRSIC